MIWDDRKDAKGALADSPSPDSAWQHQPKDISILQRDIHQDQVLL